MCRVRDRRSGRQHRHGKSDCGAIEPILLSQGPWYTSIAKMVLGSKKRLKEEATNE